MTTKLPMSTLLISLALLFFGKLSKDRGSAVSSFAIKARAYRPLVLKKLGDPKIGNTEIMHLKNKCLIFSLNKCDIPIYRLTF